MSRVGVLASRAFSGGNVLPDVGIVIEDSLIVKVGSAADVRRSEVDDVLDFRDHTVLAGLIDAHVHFGPESEAYQPTAVPGMSTPPYARLFESRTTKLIKAIQDAKNLLVAGFTSARDVGTGLGIEVRNAIRTGLVVGPRLRCSGRALTTTGGHQDPSYIPEEWVDRLSDLVKVCNGVGECIRGVREARRRGADLIKIFVNHSDTVQEFSDDEILATVAEATRLGMPVSAHVHGGSGLRTAVRAGIYTVEHGSYLEEEDCKLMAEHGTVLVPTLAYEYAFVKSAVSFGAPEASLVEITGRYGHRLQSLRMAHELGVKIATGTDFGLREFTRHGPENLRELTLLHEAGLTSTDVLNAATLHGAATMGLPEKLGKIEPGYYADLIAVEGDPVSDLTAVLKVRAVMKNGVMVRNDVHHGLPHSLH